MSVPCGDRGDRPGLPGVCRRVVVALLATVLVTGCDDSLEPFQETDDATFSMFGYLDLEADTQWVRVMPIRRTLFLEAGPIDAVVTLEHVGSGRTVTLHDSLFSFVDERLGGVAYAHNFWTTERLEAEATYRLVATRSDGASSTAVVVMPQAPDVLFVEDNNGRRRGTVIGLLGVRAERLLSVETIYDMGRLSGDPPVLGPANSVTEKDYATYQSHTPGMIGIQVFFDSMLIRPGLVDVYRRQFRLAVAGSDWPYDVELTDLDITLPSTAPTNVENGLGFVGGVATRTIPFDACDALVAGSAGLGSCATAINGETASIAGRVIGEPCGDPFTLAVIRLVALTGDGGAIRTWRTGWNGQYRFEGIEPGADLYVDLGPGTPSVHLRPLEIGEHYTVDDIVVPDGC